MNKLLLAALALSAAALSPISGHAEEVCATHVVAKGDTLRAIAKQTYGSERDYRYIYDANRPGLGISPHMIRIGMTLVLPCIEGLTTASVPTIEAEPEKVEEVAEVEETPVATALPTPPKFEQTQPSAAEALAAAQARADAKVAAQAEARRAAAAKAAADAAAKAAAIAAAQVEEETAAIEITEVKLVGFANNPPYSDPELQNGGLIATIIQTALVRGGAPEITETEFVDRAVTDKASAALPESFHLSFPWLLPDCKLSELDRDIADLCDNFAFSAPIYEAQMAMFTTSEGSFSGATMEHDLVGARICRPASMHTYDLLEDGMAEQAISLESAADLANCFDDLQNDVVDIVSVNGLTADVYFNATGSRDNIVELTELASIHTVHAMTRKDNPEGNIVLDQLNSGLWEMFSSGEWGAVAKDYLTAQIQ